MGSVWDQVWWATLAAEVGLAGHHGLDVLQAVASFFLVCLSVDYVTSGSAWAGLITTAMKMLGRCKPPQRLAVSAPRPGPVRPGGWIQTQTQSLLGLDPFFPPVKSE
ncbi:hypothetical protein BJ166DRAFT_498821 [Pestalotiopsis sp. NC0098]|nr:hypothetical protein BJ166DRAFT_498821 [Pestalotiopsis sp. NC0098]